MTTAPPTGDPTGSLFMGGTPVPPGLNGHQAHPTTTGVTAGLPGWTDRLPQGRRQRRPLLVVAGALLVLLCGIASAALATGGTNRLAVLALSRNVQAGQRLSPADLRVAHIAGDGVAAVSAAGSDHVVGQTVTASLPAGTLLNASMLTAAPLPVAGRQLVALAVKASGVPPEVSPGRQVSIIGVSTGPAGPNSGGPAGAGGPTVLVPGALVVSVRDDPASGLIVLSVQVPAAVAAAVAQASATSSVAVTLLPVTS